MVEGGAGEGMGAVPMSVKMSQVALLKEDRENKVGFFISIFIHGTKLLIYAHLPSSRNFSQLES